MSGDLDFDKTIAIIKKYFGDWKPNPEVQSLHDKLLNINVPKLTSPVEKDVYGREAEEVVLGWALPGQKDKDFDYIDIMAEVLSNNKAGLIDIDLNQAQKVLGAGSGVNGMSDYSEFIALALPKDGQSLYEARNLLLAEIAKLKRGEFDESLLQSIINNLKLQRMHALESNDRRADMFVQSFVNQTAWKDEVEKIERMSKITKADVVAFANKYWLYGSDLCCCNVLDELAHLVAVHLDRRDCRLVNLLFVRIFALALVDAGISIGEVFVCKGNNVGLCNLAHALNLLHFVLPCGLIYE